MLWQVLAIWLVVGATLIWFVRDEKALRDRALNAQALQFARVPHYRHKAPAETSAPLPPPARRPATLSRADRAFLQSRIAAAKP